MILKGFTDKYLALFHEDLEFLNIKPATTYARVSDHIDVMLNHVEELIEKGYAYEKLRSVYFNISALRDYGKLSGIDLDKIKLGITVDLDEYEKDNPRDFTLLKRSKLSELKKGFCIQTRWGNVRPSLHIQCPAILMKHLSDGCDIHLGSSELIFPHHENEQAISRALTGKPITSVWAHCGPVHTPDHDISHITLPKLRELGLSSREIRFFMLFTHYRKPILYSQERIQETTRVLNRIDDCLRSLMAVSYSVDSSETGYDQIIYDLKTGFMSALNEDLNVSKVVSVVLKSVKEINFLLEEKRIGKIGSSALVNSFLEINDVLQVLDFNDLYNDPEIKKIIDKREQARNLGQFELADKLRETLINLGVKPRDEKYIEVL